VNNTIKIKQHNIAQK